MLLFLRAYTQSCTRISYIQVKLPDQTGARAGNSGTCHSHVWKDRQVIFGGFHRKQAVTSGADVRGAADDK